MKLHFISMNTTAMQVPHDILSEKYQPVYKTFELRCFEKGITISIDIYPKEKLLDKLKEILKEDFEIELPDAIIK